jgi:DNA-directed RNA polymerase specialized sigma24 family protein
VPGADDEFAEFMRGRYAALVRAASLLVGDTVDELGRALARLPYQQRAVVVLRYYEQLSERETAEALHCSIGTVKSRGSRALDSLRADGHLSDPARAEDGSR